MKKVELKLKIEVLNVLNEIICEYKIQGNLEHKEEKMVTSIISELYDKLLRKAITHRENKKPFKISISYHEAYALGILLRIALDNVITKKTYEYNAVFITKMQIDKQL